jgi:hypothetical protein
MRLFIKYSGGMGISYQGSIDISSLPSDLYNTLQFELSEKKLQKFSIEKKNLFVTDSVIYELQFENSDQMFFIEESQANDELLELIDNLRPHLKLLPK